MQAVVAASGGSLVAVEQCLCISDFHLASGGPSLLTAPVGERPISMHRKSWSSPSVILAARWACGVHIDDPFSHDVGRDTNAICIYAEGTTSPRGAE